MRGYCTVCEGILENQNENPTVELLLFAGEPEVHSHLNCLPTLAESYPVGVQWIVMQFYQCVIDKLRLIQRNEL